MARRVGLSIVLLVIAAAAIGVWLLQRGAQEAPLVIGGDAPSATAQAIDETGYAPPPRDLLVTTNRDGTWDVLLLTVDGEQRNLTDDGSDAVDILGTWSMDGRAINFLSNRGDSESLGPTQVSVTGEDLRTLTVFSAALTMFRENQFDWDPQWSPDGNTLLWASVRDLNLELYSIATDAEFTISNAQRLTESRFREWFHTWSPDGTKIAFASDVDGNENIYVRDMATGEVIQLTDHEKDDSRPLWTRDGSEILFVSEREVPFASGDLRLYRMNPDGSNQRPYEGEPVEAGMMWSPDGNTVAYMARSAATDTHPALWQILVSNADGSDVRRVVELDADYLMPAWRP